MYRFKSQTPIETDLQPTFALPAGSRSPKVTAGEPEANLDPTTSTRFLHNFSQITVYPKTHANIQAKHSVSQPSDSYEQDADRVADRIMRMAEPHIQRACECGRGCPRCVAKTGETDAIAEQMLSPAVAPPAHGRANRMLQPKLSVGSSNDPLEQEADQIADQVLAASGHSQVSGAPPRIQRFTAQPTGEANTAPASVHRVLESPGRPLDPALQQDMAQRFGYDFSQVRVHSGATAEQSARDVNSFAYTVGHELVFGAGQFAPETNDGRRLIAHELAHVVQQSGSDRTRVGQSNEQRGLSPNLSGNDIAFNTGEYLPNSDAAKRLLVHELVHVTQSADDTTLRRAEVEDRDSICSNLQDASTDVNDWVNQELATARSSLPGINDLQKFFDDVFEKTAGGGSAPVSPIEKFIEKLPPAKRFLPPTDLAGTRFASQPPLSIYSTQGMPYLIVGPTIKINDICVGADKLGHLFQQGRMYFDLKYLPLLEDPVAAENPSTQSDLLKQGLAAAKSFGQGTEIDRAGLSTTGVYSNADLAANEAGLKFWEDLMNNPNLSFDISKYATDQWNEYKNPNFYKESVAKNVWATQLSGSWKGSLQLPAALQTINVNLIATNLGIISGTFSYPSPSEMLSPVTGSITGIITYNTTSVSGVIPKTELHGSAGSHSATPVSGVTIEFDWVSGSNNGKGEWHSSGENQLVGTYGNGSSRVDGGSFNIERIP